MKRKASQAIGNLHPSKISKEATMVLLDEKLSAVKHEVTVDQEPVRSSSARQRKAPSWLSSYVTNSSQEKEVKGSVEKPNLKITKFPTLIPPSKRGKVDSKEETKQEASEQSPLSLRRKSTLKLDAASPPVSSVKDKKPLIVTPSLLTKPTKILRRTTDSKTNSVKSVKTDPKRVVKTDTKKDIKTIENKRKISMTKKIVSKSLSKHVKLPQKNSTITPSSKGKKSSVSQTLSRNIKEDVVNDNSKVVEICDPSNSSNLTPSSLNSNSQTIPVKSSAPVSWLDHKAAEQQTIVLNEQSMPNMLEVVICISTSGALREYLTALQDNIREMIWRLQSLVPNLRIGVMAHTQGGIHDDPARGSFSAGDHNYNRMGGHSGTKWLDLGATMSQICAFVDSLESEPTLYPDYVQDNLEMALWKLQRCMTWSSFSYRSVIMIGRGRPNRTTFYHQKEHWRGWIRSALELPTNIDIPVIDWELEAKLLAEMGIHVFTIQAVVGNNVVDSNREDEGTCFFRRVAEITQSQHVRIDNASKLPEIMIGICCACHGSDLLLDHRDTVRDENDGVLPTQLTEIFVGLQLHSKSNSLSSLPSMLRNLDLKSMRQRLNGYGVRNEGSMDFEESRIESSMEVEVVKEEEMDCSMTKIKSIQANKKSRSVVKGKEKNDASKKKGKLLNSRQRYQPNKGKSELKVKAGGIQKNARLSNVKAKKTVNKAVKTVTNGRSPLRRSDSDKNKAASKMLSKRKIKVTEKMRGNDLILKRGRTTKAKDKKRTSPVNKNALKTVLKSQLKEKTRTDSSGVVKRNLNQAKSDVKSRQEKNNNAKRKLSAVKGSPGGVYGKRQNKDIPFVNGGRHGKVSPLNRKKADAVSQLRTTLGKRKTVSTQRTMNKR